MSSSVYELLTGFEIGAEFWEIGLEKSFKELLKATEAVCGLIVLYSSQEEGFIEFCSVGYGESDFYYDFLARGKGNFEKLETSPKPMVFHRTGYGLFGEKSELALTSRVFGQKMHGFVVIELGSGNSLSLTSWVLGLFCHRIASVLEKKREREIIGVATPTKTSIRDELSEFLLSQSPDWEARLREGYSKKVIVLKAEVGSGRGQIVKHFHRVLDASGEILYLSLLPDQIPKLERSLQEWSQMVGSGFLVVENPNRLNINQQRLLFEYIKKQNYNFCFLFYDTSIELPEMYPPFWRLVREVQIGIPVFSALEREKRLTLLSVMVKEVGILQNIKGLSITMESMEFLLEKSSHSTLEEIRNVLESSVLRSKGAVIQKADLERDWLEKEKTVLVNESGDLDLRKSVEALERQKILLAQKLFSGNQMRMAKALGISRGSLQYKMRQMELL